MDGNIYVDGTYLENNADWHAADARWKVPSILSVLSKSGIRPPTVADVGCGSGEIARQLAEHYPQAKITGYDVSPQAHAIASARTGGNTAFVLGDPFATGKRYDLALAIDVFEHVEDYFGFLRKMRELAEVQIYHIPLDLSVQQVLRGKPYAKLRADVGHLHYFTKDTALATLRDTGHRILRWEYTAPALHTPGSLKSRLLGIPRRLLFAVAPDLAARLFGGFSIMALCR